MSSIGLQQSPKPPLRSLANGAPIARILFASSPSLGAILLPSMIYHQLQLIVCTIIGRRAPATGAVDLSTARKGMPL